MHPSAIRLVLGLAALSPWSALAQQPGVIVVPPASAAAQHAIPPEPTERLVTLRQPASRPAQPVLEVRRGARSLSASSANSVPPGSIQPSAILKVERNAGMAAGASAASLGVGNLGLFAPILGLAAIGGAVAAAGAGGGGGSGSSTAPVSTVSR